MNSQLTFDRESKCPAEPSNPEIPLLITLKIIESSTLGELGLIVVDELHLIDEPGRGHILETLLTKTLFLNNDIQIIGNNLRAVMTKPM